MNEVITVAGLVGFLASICTIWMFIEDRIEKFRLREREKKMMPKRENG